MATIEVEAGIRTATAAVLPHFMEQNIFLWY